MSETPGVTRWRAIASIEAMKWEPGDPAKAGAMAGWLQANGVNFDHPFGLGETTTLAIYDPEGASDALPGDWVVNGQDADRRCPDGCGCRLATDDADRAECGCDGPCTAECRENGYPDAPSYRDAAVKHVMDERDKLATAFAHTCERVEAVLDKALGTEDRDGEGIAADVALLAGQRDEARSVVAEMCAHWERIGTTREEDERIPGWRERAGLEASS